MKLPESIEKLINEFNKLPGIGLKTAQRLAFYMLQQQEGTLKNFGNSVIQLKDKLHDCKICQNISEKEVCDICEDSTRDTSLLCVVAEPLDVIALEKPHIYKGRYHVLQGVIAPIDGVSPDDLKIKELLERVSAGEIKEVILATNPTMEGEATAIYLQRKLNDYPVKVTRIARGLPTGGDIEYADEVTLTNALNGRVEY